MNKQRRKEIDKLVSRLEEISSDIGNLAGEEQEFYDNAPENMVDSDKYQRADEVAMELDSMVSEVDDLVSRLQECTG